MTGGPQIALLPDGRRLHMQHGPIDLIVEAFGRPEEVRAAYGQAEACFDGLLAALVAGRELARAYVNDGGDIALHLAPGERFDAGLVGDLARPAIDGVATIDAASPVRGIATSGRGGRSLSLGIADSVTVLAHDAAMADVAATLIAGAVDVDDPAVERLPATDLDDDSDLGARLVTVAVGPLAAGAVDRALDAGETYAERLCHARLIQGAVLLLAGRYRVAGELAPCLAAPNEDRSRGLSCR